MDTHTHTHVRTCTSIRARTEERVSIVEVVDVRLTPTSSCVHFADAAVCGNLGDNLASSKKKSSIIKLLKHISLHPTGTRARHSGDYYGQAFSSCCCTDCQDAPNHSNRQINFHFQTRAGCCRGHDHNNGFCVRLQG